jgi:hypothetical protein
MTQALVHILVSGEATENNLTQQTDKRMAAVLARARIGKQIACNHRQIEPESPTIRFTRRVRHYRSLNARIRY